MTSRLGKEAVLRALKDFSGQPHAHDDLESLNRAVRKETDRGAVILLTSIIEDRLTEQIVHNLKNISGQDHDKLFGFNGPLSTFDAKLRISKGLGIINQELVGIGQVLKGMRNACAHSRREISFNTPELAAAVHLLTDMTGGDDFRSDFDELLRTVFIWMCSYFVISIQSGVDNAAEFVNEQIELTTRFAREAAQTKPSSGKRPKRLSPDRHRTKR